jgi:hypothetical protein
LKPAGRAIIVAERPLLGVSEMDEGDNDKKRESEDQTNETRILSFHFSKNDYSTRAALKLTKTGIAASVGPNIPAGPAIIARLIALLILSVLAKTILSLLRPG